MRTTSPGGSVIIGDRKRAHNAPVKAVGGTHEACKADARDPVYLERMAMVNNPCSWLKRYLWRFAGMEMKYLQSYLNWYVYLFRVKQARERWPEIARVVRHLLMTNARFDRVAIFYDEGQRVPTRALHEAFDFMLNQDVVVYRRLRYQDRRLSQVADYLSSIELAAMRYASGEESNTYRKFFGLRGDFNATSSSKPAASWFRAIQNCIRKQTKADCRETTKELMRAIEQ